MDSWGIYASAQLSYDPNREKNLEINKYKNEVKSIIEQNNIEKFIDIYALPAYAKYDLGIYYEKRFRRSKKLAYDTVKAVDNGKLRSSIINVFYIPETKNEELVTFTSKKLSTVSIKLMISEEILCDDALLDQLVINLTQELIKNA